MYLSQKGIEFVVKDIRQDPAALQELIALNVRSTPAVKIGDTVIVGFNPAKIDRALQAGSSKG